jgi:hypothetical protein
VYFEVLYFLQDDVRLVPCPTDGCFRLQDLHVEIGASFLSIPFLWRPPRKTSPSISLQRKLRSCLYKYSDLRSTMASDRAPLSFPESLSMIARADGNALAWDTLGIPERGPSYQPWRTYWPPNNIESLSEDELKSKPWLTWKRESSRPNEKPWYAWVNIFEGEVDEPCLLQQLGRCPYCGDRGCVCPHSNSFIFGGQVKEKLTFTCLEHLLYSCRGWLIRRKTSRTEGGWWNILQTRNR